MRLFFCCVIYLCVAYMRLSRGGFSILLPFENWNTRSVPSYNATVGLRYLQEAINLWPFRHSLLITAIVSAPKKHLLKFFKEFC